MGRDFQEILAEMTPERRARIEAEAARLYGEHVTLCALRKARDLTQTQLARRLGKSQVSIARLEKRSDLLLSTLRGYVEAMGGTLTVSVQFPDGEPVQIEGLGEAGSAKVS